MSDRKKRRSELREGEREAEQMLQEADVDALLDICNQKSSSAPTVLQDPAYSDGVGSYCDEARCSMDIDEYPNNSDYDCKEMHNISEFTFHSLPGKSSLNKIHADCTVTAEDLYLSGLESNTPLAENVCNEAFIDVEDSHSNDSFTLDDDEWDESLPATPPCPSNLADDETINTVNVSELLKLIDSDSEHKENPEQNFQLKLAQWAVKHNVTHLAVDALLILLRENHHPSLPKNAKTLLKTPRSSAQVIKECAGGYFWYYGILNSLEKKLSFDFLKDKESVELDVHFDGISPYKSIKRSLWPITCCVIGMNDPFIVAIWCGPCKEPTDLDEYLRDFVEESKHMMEGCCIKQKNVMLKIRYIIADAPARAWVRRVNQHGSYICCERCTVKGEWVKGRMTYNVRLTGELRTDESFVLQTQPEYHNGVSPLQTLGVNMITQFPLDAMHLLYLGIVKRMLGMLLLPKASKCKVSKSRLSVISKHVASLAPYFPSDFARKPRPLVEWKLYKAKEFRRILYYDGLILFKLVDPTVYRIFLLLFCASRILNDSKLHPFIDKADYLLRTFVRQASSQEVFSQMLNVYNVHHLIHLADECRLHGTLDSFSAFKYENFLGSLKGLLRAPGKTLTQIVHRTMEKVELLPTKEAKTAAGVTLVKKCSEGLACNLLSEQFRKVVLPSSFTFQANQSDSCCRMMSGDIVVILNIGKCNDSVKIVGRAFVTVENYFTYPCTSSSLGICQCEGLGPIKSWSVESILQKCVLLPLIQENENVTHSSISFTSSKWLVIPMLLMDE